MNHVLLISGVKGDTRRYRTFHPYEQLRIIGVPVLLAHITDSKLPDNISRAKIVIFHRTPFDALVERLITSITKQESLALIDVDDLIFEPSAFRWIDSPDFQDPVRALLYQEDIRRHRLTLDRCHAAITSTLFLAEYIRALSKPTWVHRNAFSLEMLSISEEAYQYKKRTGGKIVIGYASGTPTHDSDFAMVKPILMRVLNKYPKAELWVIGPVEIGKNWGTSGERIKRFKLVPWRKLPHLLAMFDINIAPLVQENPFSKSKSEIKYVEAGLVRAPTIASKTDAFEYAIRPGENGCLASGKGGWEEQLSQLIEEQDFRLAIGQQAYNDVIKKYHPKTRAIELGATLNEIYQQFFGTLLWKKLEDQPQTGPHLSVISGSFQIQPSLEQHPSYFEKGLYTLRYRGLRTLVMQIWIYLRRLVAPVFPYGL